MTDRGNALTARQLQVLELISQGKPNKLIARELGLAEGTVKCHVTSVLKMLNVCSASIRFAGGDN